MQTPFAEFPVDFRESTLSQILEIVGRGECLQLVALPGSGKSMLTQLLCKYPPILHFHLKDKAPNYTFIHLDLNFITAKNPETLLNFFYANIAPHDPATHPTIQQVSQAIKNYLTTPQKKLILILDSFELLAEPSLEGFFRILKSLRDQNRFNLSFIFVVEREIGQPEKLRLFSYLGTLLSENYVFLPVLTDKEAQWFLAENERQLGKKVKNPEIILGLSGRFARTIKQLCQITTTGELETVKVNPTANIHLNYHFDQLWEALAPEKQTLAHLISLQLTATDQENITTLQKLNLVNTKNEIVLPLFARFLEEKLQPKLGDKVGEKITLTCKLTANEHAALNYLQEHANEICDRAHIAAAIWGEEASLNSTNHALDQLLHRLRTKLTTASPPLTLETIRGRGFRLLV